MFKEEVEVMTSGERVLEVERKRTREEALKSFLALRGLVTGSVRFAREDLPSRTRCQN